MGQDEVFEIFELVEAARINLENLARTAPGIDANPMFKVVAFQLQTASDSLQRASK